MKKIFLFALFSLPIAGFCSFEYGDVTVKNWVNFKYTSFGVTTSRNGGFAPQYTLNSIDQFRSIVSSGEFSFCVYSNRTSSSTPLQLSFAAPSSVDLDPVAGSISKLNITNSVFCSTGSVNCAFSPMYFPEIASIYWSAATLFVNGYRGPGVLDVFYQGKYYCVNVDFPTLVSDVVSSTNTVFRSALLSSLSDVGLTLNDIVRLLGDISSRPSSGSSDVWTYDQITNFCASLPGYYLNGVYFDTDGILSKMDRSAWAPDSEGAAMYNAYVDSVGRGLPLLQSLAGLASVVDSTAQVTVPNGLSSLGDQFNRSINNALTGGGSGGGGIAGDVKRLSTNNWASVVTNQLAQNTRDAKQQLKDNYDSITNQLAHMFDDNPNSVGRAIRSTAANTATAAQGVSAISSKLDSLHVQIDNPNNIGVVLDGPVTIDTTQFNGVSVPLAGLKDKIDTWYNDWYSFWDISTPAYSWDNFYNMFRDFKDQNHSDIASITNLPFFSAVSNSLASIDNFLQTNSFSSSLHALLLDDYADYITNRFYSSAVDTFKDDYPSVYTNLVKFGLSTEDGEGNFWSLISSTLFYQSALVCGMLEDLATVRQFADDHIDGGFSGGVTSLIEKMPSSTELADRVNQASNEVFKIDAAANSFYTAYSSMTNSGISAFSPFRGIFSSVPESVVFFKTGNDQYITIPVSEGGNAWSVIRLCFSFSLVAVNVILFPKFVLMVIVLLSKLSKRFVKFVPTDAM